MPKILRDALRKERIIVYIGHYHFGQSKSSRVNYHSTLFGETNIQKDSSTGQGILFGLGRLRRLRF